MVPRTISTTPENSDRIRFTATPPGSDTVQETMTLTLLEAIQCRNNLDWAIGQIADGKI